MWAGGLPVGRGLAPGMALRFSHNVNYFAYCKNSFRRERCPQRSARALRGAALRDYIIALHNPTACLRSVGDDAPYRAANFLLFI